MDQIKHIPHWLKFLLSANEVYAKLKCEFEKYLISKLQ